MPCSLLQLLWEGTLWLCKCLLKGILPLFFTISQFLLALIFACPNLLTFSFSVLLFTLSHASLCLVSSPLYTSIQHTLPLSFCMCFRIGLYCTCPGIRLLSQWLFSLPQSHQAHSALQTQLSVSDWLNVLTALWRCSASSAKTLWLLWCGLSAEATVNLCLAST